LWLERLAWRPGPIVVHELVAADGLSGVDPVQLTNSFRQRLGTFHMLSPGGIPGAPEGDFLDVLEVASRDAKGTIHSVVALLRAAKPRHAYEVTGTVVARSQSPRFGVAVQVLRLPGQAEPGRTFWDSSWDRAIRRAADHAWASILPRTHLCQTPWRAWRRCVMPAALMHAYERAADFEGQRLYDEALASYHEALRHDPMNLALRLQIGFVQEKLALFLDALSTYEGTIGVVHPGGARLPRNLYGRAARRERERQVMIARYRMAILLTGGELERQWDGVTEADRKLRTERDWQKVHLRTRLSPLLEEHIRELGCVSDPESLELLRRSGRETAMSVEGRARYQLRALFEELALAQLHYLERRLGRRRHRPRRWLGGPQLTLSGLRLTILWTEQRQAWTAQRLDPGSAPWRPTVDLLRTEIAKIERLQTFRRWHEHYNAACVYALPLLRTRPRDEQRRDELAKAAISHLERAAACADSAFIARRGGWLVSEDPDLDELRWHWRFKAFEARYFPVPGRTPRRSPQTHSWEASQYVHELLMETAARWKEVWHALSGQINAPREPSGLAAVMIDDSEAWRLVRAAAYNRRHWASRLELMTTMETMAQRYGFDPIAVPFPRYSDRPLAEAEEDEMAMVIVEMRQRKRMLKGLIDALDRATGEKQLESATPSREDASPGDGFTEVCREREAPWRLLHDWLQASQYVVGRPTAADDASLEAFQRGFVEAVSNANVRPAV
jgi:hypothetical protein